MRINSNPLDAPVRRRTQGRLNVQLPAQLVTLAAAHAAILKDISRNGAKLSLECPPGRGSEAILKWGDFEAFCKITWVAGHCCGLSLDRALPEATLQATLALNEALHLPEHAEIHFEAVRAWAEGRGRFGFD